MKTLSCRMETPQATAAPRGASVARVGPGQIVERPRRVVVAGVRATQRNIIRL